MLHGFVHAGDVCDEPVPDFRKLEVRDQGMAVVVAGKGGGVEHLGPEFPALLECGVALLGPDRFHVSSDCGRLGLCLAGCWQGDAVGGLDVAAAVDEFRVDGAGLGRADGQGEIGPRYALVVGGEGCISDEEAVPNGDALFGENAGERGDGGGVGFGRPQLGGFAAVDREQDGRGRGVAGEVVGDGPRVGEFLAGLAGEVDTQRRADAVLVQRDADEAFLGPEAEGVPDKAENI